MSKTDGNHFIHQSVTKRSLPTGKEVSRSGGMTKREYFAARAMEALVNKTNIASPVAMREVATLATNMADALIEQLNKTVI